MDSRLKYARTTLSAPFVVDVRKCYILRMDFTIKFKDGKTKTYQNVRGLHIVEGVWSILPGGHKKKIEVMTADIDVISAHVLPVSKVRSIIKAQVETADAVGE